MDKETKKPNIIFIFSDQHRFCDVGYQGNSEVETPTLDRLAEEGAMFSAAYTNCPLCVPARGSLLTSLHALRHGAVANDMPIISTTPSVADVLNDAGYKTAYIGKWHLGGTPRDQFITHYNRLGFQYWRANNCNHNYLKGYYDTEDNKRHAIEGYAPIGETDIALEFMQENKNEQYALFLNFGTPHDPYDLLPPGEYEKALEKEYSLRANCEETPREGEWAYKGYKLQEFYAGYYAHIKQIDLQIKRITKWLKENQQYEKTILVYTSDHGDMLGSHGYLHKQIYFDESARIPLIISWPEHISGGERKQAISLVDVIPTILGMIGLRYETEVDGEDCSKVLWDASTQSSRYVYMYSYVPCHQAKDRAVESWRAVTNGEMTLAADQSGDILALYDMKKDPLQQHNMKDNAMYQKERDELVKILNEQVEKNDGYQNWKVLLKKNNLEELWDESESHFEGFFKNTKK